MSEEWFEEFARQMNAMISNLDRAVDNLRENLSEAGLIEKEEPQNSKVKSNKIN